jgi:hypothetical protein
MIRLVLLGTYTIKNIFVIDLFDVIYICVFIIYFFKHKKVFKLFSSRFI